MEREHDEEKVSYVIPSRTITGSVPEIIEEIDDMMEALQTVREAVVKRAPRPARPASTGGWRGRVGRALQKLHLISA
jgi:hypothetical protein